MLPPNQHPLDWYVIPELKGDTSVSFMSYTKSGWMCRLCDNCEDKFQDVQEHCQTIQHQENHFHLERRRRELQSLVQETERALYEHHAKQLQIQHEEQKEEEAREEERLKKERQEEYLESQVVPKLEATQRRANLKGEYRDRIAAASSIRVKDRVVEDYGSSRNSSSSSSTSTTLTSRQLRAQRLAKSSNKNLLSTSKAPHLKSSKTPKQKSVKEQEKEARLQKMKEISEKHRELQKKDEMELQKRREQQRLEEEEARKAQMYFDCFGTSFLNPTAPGAYNEMQVSWESTKVSCWEEIDLRFGL